MKAKKSLKRKAPEQNTLWCVEPDGLFNLAIQVAEGVRGWGGVEGLGYAFDTLPRYVALCDCSVFPIFGRQFYNPSSVGAIICCLSAVKKEKLYVA